MRGRSLRAAAALVALLVAVPACGGGKTQTVGYAKGGATIRVNDVLRVDLGDYNASIGDSWYEVKRPDSKVLKDYGDKLDSNCKPNEGGCGGRLYWEFLGFAKGTTSVRFQYCYRSTRANCQPGPGRGPKDSVLFNITVS
jgi:predicted secreted protein